MNMARHGKARGGKVFQGMAILSSVKQFTGDFCLRDSLPSSVEEIR